MVDPDGMRCEPILDESGEVVAVVRVSADMDERGRAALMDVIAAARRMAEEKLAADPGLAERQRVAVERIRARGHRLRGESDG